MPNAPRIARIGHADEVEEMAEAVRSWEPRLDLAVYLEEPTLYDPDATVYGIGLSDRATLSVRHKPHVVRRGDAIVVPQSVAIEADPAISLLAIRHEGTPPAHFRERFIQTWGIDFRPVPASGIADLPLEVIPDTPARYRIPYHCLELNAAGFRDTSGLALHLLMVVEGQATLAIEGGQGIDLRADQIAMIPSGTGYVVTGRARLGRLILETETAHIARGITESAQGSEVGNPEYRTST